MNTPLITIQYKEYLSLKRTQLQLRIELLDTFISELENNNLNSKEDVLRVIKTLRNRYLNELEKADPND